MDCIESRFQITTPIDIKICRGYLCLLHINYAFLDRRGRRSLQEISKLPYEKCALASAFFLAPPAGLAQQKGHSVTFLQAVSAMRTGANRNRRYPKNMIGLEACDELRPAVGGSRREFA